MSGEKKKKTGYRKTHLEIDFTLIGQWSYYCYKYHYIIVLMCIVI